MSKEKLIKLTKYSDSIKSKLAEKVLPEKQKNRPEQYRQFLERELAMVTSKMDVLKMSVDTKK